MIACRWSRHRTPKTPCVARRPGCGRRSRRWRRCDRAAPACGRPESGSRRRRGERQGIGLAREILLRDPQRLRGALAEQQKGEDGAVREIGCQFAALQPLHPIRVIGDGHHLRIDLEVGERPLRRDLGRGACVNADLVAASASKLCGPSLRTITLPPSIVLSIALSIALDGERCSSYNVLIGGPTIHRFDI